MCYVTLHSVFITTINSLLIAVPQGVEEHLCHMGCSPSGVMGLETACFMQ
jgi:hypothetical protein